LNVLPKKSFATDYSYRTQRRQQQQLLAGWVKQLSPLLLPEARSFSLDFHPIPYRGDLAVLENHYLPCRGHARPSVQSFFAQEHETHVFCYANANLTRDEQAEEVLRFVNFWHALTGRNPEWLYFDAKLTTYAELSRLNERGVYFATIRRRGLALLKRLRQRPTSDWIGAVIDIPKRQQQHIRYLEETVTLPDYPGAVRQVAVTGLGREEPTLFLTNHFEVRPRHLIINYARRNGIEDGLGTNVNFFHLDCLASEVRLNVDLDVTLTVIANGCYRWLAHQLKGFEQAKPKQLYPQVHRNRRAGRSPSQPPAAGHVGPAQSQSHPPRSRPGPGQRAYPLAERLPCRVRLPLEAVSAPRARNVSPFRPAEIGVECTRLHYDVAPLP
jgi:hypothetical protein